MLLRGRLGPFDCLESWKSCLDTLSVLRGQLLDDCDVRVRRREVARDPRDVPENVLSQKLDRIALALILVQHPSKQGHDTGHACAFVATHVHKTSLVTLHLDVTCRFHQLGGIEVVIVTAACFQLELSANLSTTTNVSFTTSESEE